MDLQRSGWEFLLAYSNDGGKVPSVFADEQMLPAYAAMVSAIVLLVQVFIEASSYGLLKRSNDNSSQDCPSPSSLTRKATKLGSKFVLGLRVARTVSAVFWLVSDWFTAKRIWMPGYNALASTADYMVLLGLLSIGGHRRLASTASRHLTLVALVFFGVYVHRDILPLTTSTTWPLDDAQGPLLWVKIALVAYIGIVEPLVEPKFSAQCGNKAQTASINPEQVASLASQLFYGFLDSTVFKAYRMPHLPADDLPPLCDYDEAKRLKERSRPYLNLSSRFKPRQLFWSLVRIFRVTLVEQSVLLAIAAIARMGSPVATNRLLNYLEQRLAGEVPVVKPWVWIALIGLGPIICVVAKQRYQFLSAATSVRLESILTTLVFEQMLRIRMKADSRLEGAGPGQTGSPPTQGNASDNLYGKLNNLVSSDLANVTGGRDFLLVVLSAPLEIGLSLWFLYKILGWSSIVGLVVMIMLFPAPGLVAGYLERAEQQKMKATDARIQDITEMMTSLRMIKLFGWETFVRAEAAKKRDVELAWIWRGKVLDVCNGILNHFIPVAHMIVSYSIFTVVMKQKLNASIVFSSIAAFGVLRGHAHSIFFAIPSLIRAKVSLQRMADFLSDADLLDRYTDQAIVTPPIQENPDIGFGSAVFSWAESSAVDEPSSSADAFQLRIEDPISFEKGRINIIVGPTGCGKTSMLMALLGEMHYAPLSAQSWVNLPREGGVAYAAQVPWIQNATIKENILFGSAYDEERYHKVIRQCGLQRDLELLDAGDSTEIGENGVTLSGGQKARVSLARAVYSQASILLFDDVLSALDTYTSRWVADECLKGDLIKGRTVILVTHNVLLVRPITAFVVSLTVEGRVSYHGSVSDDVLGAAGEDIIAEETEPEEVKDEAAATQPSSSGAVDGKLIVAEEVQQGHVRRNALMLFFGALGGGGFWFTYLFTSVVADILNSLQYWWLGWWAAQYTMRAPEDVSVAYYLGAYGLLVGVVILFHIIHMIAFAAGSIRSSRAIHTKLIASLVGSTFRWIDTTPLSRIITRCTQDIQSVDGPVAEDFSWLVHVLTGMVTKLGAVVVYAPAFLFAGILVAVIGGLLGQIYMKAQLPVKREMSNAKAPVLAVLGESITGLTSIRAYGVEEAFKEETERRIDRYVRCARTFFGLGCWMSVRVDTLSALFTVSLAAYLTYRPSAASSSAVGFTLIMATSFSDTVLFVVRIFNRFQVSSNSLERIQQYLVIEQEPEPTDNGTPPAYWPASGALRVENLCARYSPEGPRILKDVSFEIRAGERVGIVGRTGSGKSTLTLALLRSIYTEGTVLYDGVATDQVNLDALRSNITIIPQSPELLSGTLRRNLDMFGQYDDAVLNDALRTAGLFSLQLSDSEGEGRFTLDSKIASNGSNLSVGQRQIIALARAILRQSKILILDEATSAIDYETDNAIQTSLRNELKSDVTVLTIAHRLRTIMDSDRIMVLDEGHIVEFDSPMTLMQDEKSLLRALVEESADKDVLHAMIRGEA